jgi:hypothetical protein
MHRRRRYTQAVDIVISIALRSCVRGREAQTMRERMGYYNEQSGKRHVLTYDTTRRTTAQRGHEIFSTLRPVLEVQQLPLPGKESGLESVDGH